MAKNVVMVLINVLFIVIKVFFYKNQFDGYGIIKFPDLVYQG